MKTFKHVLLGLFILFNLKVQATTYYLETANASVADLPSSWNTAQNGSGTNFSSWTTASLNDTFIIPNGVDGIWSSDQTIGNSGVGAQSFTFIVNGTLTIEDDDILTFDGSANNVVFTINGSLTINEPNAVSFATSDIDTIYIKFSSGSNLISNNFNGLRSSGSAVFGNSAEIVPFYAPDVNYTFINTTSAITPRGLQDSVNNLSITVTGFTATLQSNILINGVLTLSGGTLAIVNRTLTIGTTGSFTHSAGEVTINSGIFRINGTYSHASGTFTITNLASVNIGSTGTMNLTSGVFNMLGRTLTCAGTITRTAGSIHYTAGSGTALFTNTTAKTLPIDLYLRYPNNFTLNGAGGITLGGNTRPSATDSLGVVTFTSGNLTLTSGITAISSITGSGGNIVGNATATLTFYGASTNTIRLDQTTPGTTNAVSVLNLNGTSNLTLGTNFYVATTLTLNSRTVTLGTFTLTKNGDFTKGTEIIQLNTGTFNVLGTYTHVNSGTLTFSTGILSVGSLSLPADALNIGSGRLRIGGSVSRTTGSIYSSSGTVEFVNTSNVTIPSNTFIRYPLNLILNGVGGVTLGGNTRPAATDSLATVTFTSGNLTLTGGITAISTISGSGGNIIGNATATLTLYSSGTKTLIMNQTTPGTTNAVAVLNVNQASNLTLGSNLDIKTTLTLGARTLNLGSFTLTKTGTFSNGTATIGLSTGTLNVLGAYTHVISGPLTFSTGTLSVGSLVLTSGNINVSTGTLIIGGAVSRGTGQIYAPSGTVSFTNSSAITLPSNTFIGYPSILVLNGAGGVTLGGNTRTAVTDSLATVTFTLGNLSLHTGITTINNMTGSGGNIVGNATATLVFYGSATHTLLMNQTTPGTSNALATLILNETVDLNLGSNLNVNSTLTLNSRTLNLNSFTLTKTGTFTNGTATIQLGTGTLSVSGAYTHVSTGTLTFGSGNLSVGSLALTSGNINVSIGILSIGGTVSRTSGQIHAPSGTVIFTNGSAVTLPSNTFVTYPANFTLNGAGGVTLGGKTGTLKDSVGNLTFTSGNLTITTDTICIGSITGFGGSIVGNTSSTVRFYGSSSSTLRTSQTTPGTSNAVKNLLLTGSSNVTLGTATRIAAEGLVNIPSNTTLNTGGLLTIVSNATGHGRVGTVGGTFTSSSTDSIQLFIPGGERGYRLFGNPFTSALAISQYMDNSTEIDITGAGGSGNGFTNTTNNNPSAYSYNTSGNSWDAFTSTSQTISIGAGAHILVRGVKGEGLDGSVYTPSASTIRLAGQFRTGNVVTSLSDAGFGWNLVANPYPSNIDIDQISGGNWVNVNASIYGYDKVNRTYSAYSKNIGNAVNNLSNIIEMGSSFLAEVTTTGSASITFTEAIKTSASSTVGGNPIFTPKEERLNQFKINLNGAEGADGNFQDECLLSFGNTSNSTPEFDPQSDAWDLGGELLNVSIITPKNDYLAINEYPTLDKQTEAIPLNVWSKNNGEYTLAFTEVSALNENTQIWLRDKYKGEVHFIQESPYKFEINDFEESYGANRFELFTNVTSSIQNVKSLSPLKLFPNPIASSSKEIDIFIAGEGHSFIIPRIYDMSGRLIFEGSKTIVDLNKTSKISLPSNLNAQNYILTCETAQGIFNQQLTITE